MYNDVRLKMSPPWITYVNELTALFKNDPAIKIRYDNDGPSVYLTVNNAPDKAAALAQLLPEEVYFGNVCLDLFIEGEISNKIFVDKVELFETLFGGNSAFAFVYPVEGIFSNRIIYVVFKNCVVQFFNDNLNDLHGNISTLYEDIAADVFEDADIPGVFFCTDIEETVGKPLGEWP